MTRTALVVALAGTALVVPTHACRAQTDERDEVRAVVAEMLANAQSRSSLLAGGSAGYDGAFFLASDNGDFRLNVSGFLQFRYLMDFRSDDNTIGADPGDEFEPGFQMRRMKLGFAGNVYKDWGYKVLLNFSRTDGTAILQDAYIDRALTKEFKLRFGQAKLPLLREELMDDKFQLAAERSLVNSAFSQDRSQMVQISYEGDPVVVRLAYSDGINSDNTDFTAPESSTFIISGEADWAVTTRVEYMISGQPKYFNEFTAGPDEPFGALLGAAIHAQQSPDSQAPTDTDRTTIEYTVDLSLKGSGWNAYAAFIGRNDDFRSAGTSTTFDDFAAIVQGGFRIGQQWEPFVRGEAFFFDSNRGLQHDSHYFITVGVNNYIAGQAAKLTVDAVIAIDDTTDMVNLGILPDTGVGLLGSSQDAEVVVRLQFQLLF